MASPPKFNDLAQVAGPPKFNEPVSNIPTMKPEDLPLAPPASAIPTVRPEDLPTAPSNSVRPDAGSFYEQGLAPVKAMQQSLINLSSDIALHNIQSTPNRQIGEHDTLTGADPFMNFLVNSYMNKSKTFGKQVVNVDAKQPIRMDTSKQNDSFKGVLTTISRIGSPGSEKKPDGSWGPRTNNALKQVYALAYALMQVQKDMGMEVPGFTDSDLTELHNNIPQDITHTNIHDKIKMASAISKSLDKFRSVYDNFREKILNHPEYSAHISQAKPLYIQKGKDMPALTLNNADKQLYDKYKSTELDVTLNQKPMMIMPYNLSSMDNFKKYVMKNATQIGLSPEEIDSIKKGDPKKVNDLLIDLANSFTGGQ